MEYFKMYYSCGFSMIHVYVLLAIFDTLVYAVITSSILKDKDPVELGVIIIGVCVCIFLFNPVLVFFSLVVLGVIKFVRTLIKALK